MAVLSLSAYALLNQALLHSHDYPILLFMKLISNYLHAFPLPQPLVSLVTDHLSSPKGSEDCCKRPAFSWPCTMGMALQDPLLQAVKFPVQYIIKWILSVAFSGLFLSSWSWATTGLAGVQLKNICIKMFIDEIMYVICFKIIGWWVNLWRYAEN